MWFSQILVRALFQKQESDKVLYKNTKHTTQNINKLKKKKKPTSPNGEIMKLDCLWFSAKLNTLRLLTVNQLTASNLKGTYVSSSDMYGGADPLKASKTNRQFFFKGSNGPHDASGIWSYESWGKPRTAAPITNSSGRAYKCVMLLPHRCWGATSWWGSGKLEGSKGSLEETWFEPRTKRDLWGLNCVATFIHSVKPVYCITLSEVITPLWLSYLEISAFIVSVWWSKNGHFPVV